MNFVGIRTNANYETHTKASRIVAQAEYQIKAQNQYLVQTHYQVEADPDYQGQTIGQEHQVEKNIKNNRSNSTDAYLRLKHQTHPNDCDTFGIFSSLSDRPVSYLRVRKKYHSLLSQNSSACSQSTRSGYIFGQSPLDDPSFAPPPKPVFNMEVIDSTRNKTITSTLPLYDMVKHSGNVMARISLKSLFLKKWKQMFWIAYGDHELLFFRSKTDFNEWATNPYLTNAGRMSLVKLDIDLKNDVLKPGVRCYRALSLQEKEYVRSGLMHTFKLEQWMNYGPIIIGAFASKSRKEIRSLLIVLKEMIKREKNGLSDFMSDEGSIHYDSDSQGHQFRSSFSTRSLLNFNFELVNKGA